MSIAGVLAPRRIDNTSHASVFGAQTLDLSHRNVSDEELQSVLRLIVRGQPQESIDLRASLISLQALLSICQALENAARADQKRSGLLPSAGLVPVQRWPRAGGNGTASTGHSRPPCWLELGDNPQFQPSDAIEYLRSHNVRCCLPLRCSRRRCMYGATIHVSCKVRRFEEAANPRGNQRIVLPKPDTQGEVTGPVNQLQHSPVPVAQPTAAVPAAIHLPGRLHPSEEVPAPDLVPRCHSPEAPVPDLAPRCHSPLFVQNLAMEFSQGQRVYAICSDSGDHFGSQPQILQVSLFEELEVLQAVPLGVLSTGYVLVRRSRPVLDIGWVAASSLVADPCEERAYQTMARKKDVDGLCAFLQRAVERLGGEVMRYDSLRAFAKECCCLDRTYREPLSYQSLLELLHRREERDRIGVRQPGDSYITVEEC